MGLKAGALLWNRQRLTLQVGATSFDTKLTQVNQSFAGMSPNEPPLGVVAAPPGPADGTTPGSRVQVIPQAPLSAWTNVTHGEPFLNSATDTVWVTFHVITAPATVNVLFWDPHSMIGPGNADTYH